MDGKMKKALLALSALLLVAGCSKKESSETKPADTSSVTVIQDIRTDGMQPWQASFEIDGNTSYT